MDDNAIVYLLSFVGVVLIFIEWLRISRKRSILSMIIFLSYSAPLYYLMIFKGHGEVVLLYRIVKSYIKNH